VYRGLGRDTHNDERIPIRALRIMMQDLKNKTGTAVSGGSGF